MIVKCIFLDQKVKKVWPFEVSAQKRSGLIELSEFTAIKLVPLNFNNLLTVSNSYTIIYLMALYVVFVCSVTQPIPIFLSSFTPIPILEFSYNFTIIVIRRTDFKRDWELARPEIEKYYGN